MSQQFWVVPDNADPTKLAVIGKTPEPKNAIATAPYDPLTGLLEEGIWLQIEEIERPDEPGVFDKVATVDDGLKTSILAERETDRLQNENQRQTRDSEFRGFKKTVKRIKHADLSTAEGIKTAIINIQNLLVKLEERSTNIDPGE